LDLQEARRVEPALSQDLIAAYLVRDASLDPFMLSLDNMAQARQMGSQLLRFQRVMAFNIRQSKIASIQLLDTETGKETILETDLVVNAAGAWAGQVAGLAGIKINVLYSKGSLVITHNRLTERIVNRLRPASNGDILVPGGTVSILGTTSVRVEDPDQAYPTVEEIDVMVEDASAMIPALDRTRYIRAYCGVRPLFQGDSSGKSGEGNDRSVSRGFALIDHAQHGVENFITITGGKLTTYRLMAEKTADLVCQHLGVASPCLTRTEPLPASQQAKWTEPALAPKTWLEHHEDDDMILCDCEMIPKSTLDALIDSLHEQGITVDLPAIGLRSRVGKGPCQGSFCGPRITGYLFDKGELGAGKSLDSLGKFVRSRWKGLYAILWGQQLKQAELMEAMECGLLGLELVREVG
jgi:glycerol-3-phosphate dehydrogenase